MRCVRLSLNEATACLPNASLLMQMSMTFWQGNALLVPYLLTNLRAFTYGCSQMVLARRVSRLDILLQASSSNGEWT